MTRTELAAWCAEQAEAFRRREHTDAYPLHADRDTALITWALHTLGNVDCDGSGEALEHVDWLRAVGHMEAVAQ